MHALMPLDARTSLYMKDAAIGFPQKWSASLCFSLTDALAWVERETTHRRRMRVAQKLRPLKNKWRLWRRVSNRVNSAY